VQALQATAGEGAISLAEFWKNFNIKQVFENIYELWQEVAANTTRAVWKYLLPYCANNFYGFRNRIDAVIEEISDIGKDFAFEDVDSPSVKECLNLHSQPLTDMDIIELEQHHTYDEKEEIAS
jgi:hypothetical protein